MNTDLHQYFNYYRKPELEFLLRFFHVDYVGKPKKEELVRMAVELIGNDPVSWLFKLPERDLRLLASLLEKGDSIWHELDEPDFPCFLDSLRLIIVDDINPLHTRVMLPFTIANLVSPFILDVIKDKESMGLFEEERITVGILNIYGAIPHDDFIKLLLEVMDNDEERILRAIRNPILAHLQGEYKGKWYTHSPYVYDVGLIVENRKAFSRKIRKYLPCTIEQAKAAGAHIPYCAYGSGEAAEVMKVLEELGYSEAEAIKELNKIWFNSQFASDEAYAEAMFNCVNERMDDIPSFALYRQYIDTIAAYSNSVPKWLLKGRSSNESNLLKLLIKVEESDEFEPLSLDQSEYSIPESGTLEQFYKMGIGVRHVHPEDPCPCGSGLSYKNCHGRKLN